MLPQKLPTADPVDSKTYPLGENCEHSEASTNLALVALSHTQLEHRLYAAMLVGAKQPSESATYTARHLMDLTGIRSLSTVRRGLEGLVVKLSIEKNGRQNGVNKRDQAHSYRVYPPNEVIARRQARGHFNLNTDTRVPVSGNRNHAFTKAISRVAENPTLSRREAQVALCCVEGLTNAEIGKRVGVSEQTVKFHLRHVFIKVGVKRRAELISRLLT